MLLSIYLTITSISFRNDIFPDMLLPNLSLNELRELSLCNTTTMDIVTKFLERQPSLRFVLEPYFSKESIHVFTDILYNATAFVSGSAALSFFTRRHYPNSDLDIFVPLERCSTIAIFLNDQGYYYEKRPPARRDASNWWDNHQGPNYPLSIGHVMDFVDKDRKKVQVIVIIGSLFEVVLGFHSSKLISCQLDRH